MDDALLTAGLIASLLGGASSKKPLTADETKQMRGKIPDLQVGEKLRYLGTGGIRIPSKGDTVVVASLDIPVIEQESDAQLRRYDFTAFFRDDDGKILEYAFDSRHFERA